MSKEIVLTTGLPASGKTTFAIEQVRANPDKWVNVNKDDLRAMLFDSQWSKGREKMVIRIRDAIVRDALANGKSVIVSDTNLDDSHLKRMKEIASEFENVTVRVKSFTDVPLEECIRRNAARAKPVPEHVIRDMNKKYLQKEKDWGFRTYKEYEHKDHLPTAVIIDLDGTISINDGHRGWYDEHKVYHDKPNFYVVNILNALAKHHPGLKFIYCSGRKDTSHGDTKAFILTKANLPVDHLLMRSATDTRKDAEVKKDLYDAHIKDKYNIIAVFDDRPSVCEVWFKEGLPIFRVGNPTLDF